MPRSSTVARYVALVLSVALLSAAPAGAAFAQESASTRRSPTDALLTPLARVLGVSAGRVPERVVLYQVGPRGQVHGDLEEFSTMVTTTLRDPRGWNLDGAVGYIPVRRDGDVRIWLAAPAAIERAHPTCDAAYSCRVGKDVYINDERWRKGADTYARRPLADYRRYVVNHELGHWLGLDHRDCRSTGAAAWVMQQQTISVGECTTRVWPQRHELQEARRNLLAP